jgi:hypothetical protein
MARGSRGDEMSLADILAQARRFADEPAEQPDVVPHITGLDEDGASAEIRVEAGHRQPTLDYLLHETEMLRRPVYRPERPDVRSADTSPVLPLSVNGRPVFDEEGRQVVVHENADDTHIISSLGQLNARDLLVMGVLQRAFVDQGCPTDNKIRGSQATLYYLAHQIGINDSATHLIRETLERLKHTRVKLRFDNVERARARGYRVNEQGEIDFNLIGTVGWRSRSTAGDKQKQIDCFIQLNQDLGDLLRSGKSVTSLRADMARALKDRPVALKLYAWSRTMSPDAAGYIGGTYGYRVSTLCSRLGVADTNVTRRRKKVLAALDQLHRLAPEEFPDPAPKLNPQDGADPVIRFRRRVLSRPPARVLRATATA